jgi:hypothetical protein
MKIVFFNFALNKACSLWLSKLLPGLILLFFVPVMALSQTAFRLKFFQERLHEVSDFSFLPPGLTPEMLAMVPSDERNARNPLTILPFEGAFYAFRECFFDVYVWEDTVWVNQYPGKVYGYNCFSHQFVIDGHIYSIGRYGFYKMHSELIKWSPRDKRWNMVPVDNMPDHYSSSLLAQKGKSIISLFGAFLNESHSLLKDEPNGYLLDVEKRQCFPLVVKSKSLKGGTGQYNETFDLVDYLVFKHVKESITGYFILDKNSLELYFWNKPNTMGPSPFFFSSGNLLVYQELRSGLVFSDFDQGREEFEEVGSVAIRTKKFYYGKVALVAALILVFTLTLYLLARKRTLGNNLINNGQNGLDSGTIESITQKLISRSGQILPIDEIDELLGIDYLPNPDYKRVRRSKLINDINSRYKTLYGKELIGRSRNELDKRLMEYKIG